jgi:hypothetical protein
MNRSRNFEDDESRGTNFDGDAMTTIPETRDRTTSNVQTVEKFLVFCFENRQTVSGK